MNAKPITLSFEKWVADKLIVEITGYTEQERHKFLAICKKHPRSFKSTIATKLEKSMLDYLVTNPNSDPVLILVGNEPETIAQAVCEHFSKEMATIA